MPIIANNIVIAGNQVEQKQETVQPVKPVQVSLKPLEEVSMVPKTDYSKKDQGIVIVDGKEKKISKQSAYLLDMLSIDND